MTFKIWAPTVNLGLMKYLGLIKIFQRSWGYKKYGALWQ